MFKHDVVRRFRGAASSRNPSITSKPLRVPSWISRYTTSGTAVVTAAMPVGAQQCPSQDGEPQGEPA